MKTELESLFWLWYADCFDYFRDRRDGEDSESIAFDMGSLNAIKRAIFLVGATFDHATAEHLMDALRDEARKDETARKRKGYDEVAELAAGLLEAAS